MKNVDSITQGVNNKQTLNPYSVINKDNINKDKPTNVQDTFSSHSNTSVKTYSFNAIQSIKQEIPIESSLEGFFITVNESECGLDKLANKYQEIIGQYILDDTSKIKEIVTSYIEETEETSLFIICNIGNQEIYTNAEHGILDWDSFSQKQCWITLGMIKSDKDFVVFIKDSLEQELYQSKKEELKELIISVIKNQSITSSVQLIEHSSKEVDNNIAISLKNIEIIINFLQNEKERSEKKFQEITFCKQNEAISINKLLIEEGLNDCQTKEELQKILFSLRKVIDQDLEYKLPNDSLLRLSQTLTSENFKPEGNDKIDLKKEVIKLIGTFRDRGQVFDEATAKNLTTYFQINKDNYTQEIDKFDNKLHQDSRNAEAKGALGFVLKDRTEFLMNMDKLAPETLNIADLDKFIGSYEGISQKQVLENRKAELDKKLKVLHQEIFSLREQQKHSAATEKYEESLKINDEIIIIRQKLNYYNNKSEVLQLSNIDNLVIVLGEKVELASAYSFSQDTIDQVIEVGKVTQSQEVALAVVKVLACSNILPNDKQVEKVLINVLPQIAQDNAADLVITLAKKLDLTNHPSLLKFMHQALIENESLTIRSVALEVLQSCKSYPNNLKYIKQAVNLEEQYLQKDKSILQGCLKQVGVKNKLTLNCFIKLADSFGANETSSIIKEIVEQNIQEVPKIFIESFKEYVKSSSNKKDQINTTSISKSLVTGQYITLSEVNNIGELMNDPSTVNDVLDIIFIEFSNGHDISHGVIARVKDAAVTNEYAANILRLIEKTSGNIDILKNPRRNLIERKEALNNIISDNRNHTPYTVKILESLIKYDNDLRVDGFKALVTILPNDYAKKGFAIDLTTISEGIYYENANIEDIATLVHKDNTTDLSAIIDLVIDRINGSSEDKTKALKLLEIIALNSQEKKSPFSNQQIQNLFKIAFSTTDSSIKDVVIHIIEDSIAEEEITKYVSANALDTLKNLAKLDNKDNINDVLKRLTQSIEEGYVVTEDKITLLIDNLKNIELREHHKQISDLLLKIDLKQGLRGNTKVIHDLVNKNTSLIAISSMVQILINGLSKGAEISEKIIQGLWEQLSEEVKDKELKQSLIFAVTILVDQEIRVPKRVLSKIGELLADKGEDISLRIASVQIVSKEIKKSLNYSEVPESVIEQLETVSLEARNSQSDDLLNKIAFQALEKTVKLGKLSKDFLVNYYNNFKARGVDLQQNFTKKDYLEQLTPLTNYIVNGSNSNLQKFHLLTVLNNSFLNRQEVDTTIFTQFHESEWQKEVLCSELLAGIFKLTSEEEGVDEFELQKFMDNINLLTKFISKQNNLVNNSIENVLQVLIDQQNIYQLNLVAVNDLLTLLRSDEKALDILKSNSSSFFIELRELWLAKKLEHLDIEFTTEDLKTLNQYIPYRAEVINDSLEKVKDTAEIKELTAFFATLANCGFTRQTNEYFLTNEIVNTTNVSEWRIKLADKLVGILLNSKFPSYNNYFKGDNYNFKLKTAFIENAYNQADTTYWYSADDIAQISSELMQDFEDFRITQALGQQEDRSLETILTEVLVEYKQDRQPTFIPLNIAGNHWVSLALIHDQGKDVALYKDSLGEDNNVAEREEVRKILVEALTNLDFRLNSNKEQFDGHNCGIFALANIRMMAEQVYHNWESFIENFESQNFVTQEEAIKLRREEFPKMYALSLCQPYKRREVTNHHYSELKAIKILLEERVSDSIVLGEEYKPENGLRISIALPQEENLLKKDYQYIYVIEADKNVDFSQNSGLRTKITEELGITEIYSTEGNIIKILDKKLTAPIQKQQKLDLSQLTLKTSGNEIKELLEQLSVEATKINKDILRVNLGVPQEEDLSHKSDNIINIKDYQLLNDLHKKLTKILASGWSIDSVRKLIADVDSKEKLQNLLNSIDPIYEYKLKEYDSNIKGKSLLAIFRDDSPAKWAKEIHDLAIFQTFKGSYDKKLAQLKDEILELNRDQDISFLQDEQLITGYKEVNLAYSNKSVLFPYSDIIQNWTKKEIKQWSAQVKKYETDIVVSQYEKIAVVKRAVEVTGEEAGRKISPRDIQLLSVLIMLNHEKDKGRLAQINTGEGKTTIVAMLTAIKALEGHKVDIITSSPELAKPQAIQQKKFFDKFGFTVSHNGKDEIDIKERYKADIVYGSASDFQGDILRDEYSKLGTRSGRKCDIAIVDEVDSMLIDGKNHIVMLSSPMPAMDHLEPLLSAIWIQIGEVAKCIKENNGKAFYVEPQDMIGNDGKLKASIVEQAYLIEGTKEEFIKNCTEKHIRKMLRDVENLLEDDKIIPSEYPEIKIPEHLRQLVTEVQIPKWIDSAIHAKYRCENGKHYILKDGKIAPVDANNTGVVQANMHWSNGLHQFLQIKHGTKITAESLTTNFVSNVTYFKRYGHNIYGLTGTLGSNNARELLNKTYEVDSVIIPPFRQKQYQELTPIITNKENGWYNNIVESSINKLNNGRGVLVITKYIKEVDEIKNRLISAGYDASKIKLYKDERDAHVIEEELKPGEIIIATNIAGRGTDIKADKIEKNGGLHVCITFLPPNERVEQQNVGRTSRTGNRGTSQLILLEARENDFNKLRTIRDIQEEYALKNAGTEIERVTIKDALFVEFCNLLSELEAPNTKEIVLGLKNQLLQSKVDYQDITDKIKIRAIEERFGIWLKRQEADIATGKIKKEEILSNFKKFKQQILNDKANDKLIKNPYFYVLSGNKLLEGEVKHHHVMSGEELREGKNNKKAIEEFTRAIALDPHFSANAYYNRGYALIAEYGGDAEKHKEQIVKAIADFKEAKRIIEENLEPMLHVIQKASNSEALSEQVSHKMTLFGIQKNAIASAIGTGIGSVDKEIEVLESQKKQPGLISKDIEAINKQIESLKENKAAREKGVIGQAMAQKRDLKIELVDIAKSLPEDQDINLYKEEIDEYKNNGFRGSFQVTEVKPIDWLSVIGVGAIALAQLVGGAALAVFTLGAGSTIGMGLMSEGVADLITMVKDGIINRSFSWESYGIQKAISMTVSLVCAGFKAIKDVAKTAYAGMKSIQTAMTTTVKAGWQLAAKAMGVSLAKGVAKELVTQLVDYGVNQALMPSIQQEVMKRIEKPIQDALLNNPNVKKMLELDGKNRNNYYQNLIKNKAMELLNPQQDKEHALLTITKGIAKGIATNKIQGLSTILQIDDAIQALDKLDEFVPNFIDSLNKVIEELSKNEKVDEKFMEFNRQNNTKETKIIQIANNAHDVNYTSNYILEKEEGDIENKIGKDTKDEEQIQLERGNKSPEELRKGLASSVSVNMCNIIQSKLITPLTHAGIDYGMNKLTAGLDKHIQDGIGNFQAERRIEFFQDGDKDNRIDEEFKQGIHDKAAVAKADSMIDDLKNGGEAGLPHLGPLSDEAGRPIKVLDEYGNHVRTIGGDKGGEPIEVQYHKPNKDNPSGHWTLPGGKDAPSSGEKNCLFDVVAAQTKKDPNQLRANTAQRMENNKAMVANQAHDIKRLEIYKKDALTMGGKARWNPDHKNLNEHYENHGAKFPECKNAEEYGEKANDLLDNPPEGSEVIEYYDENGNKKKAVYDPKSNTIAIAFVDEKVKDQENTATMFKPGEGKKYVDRLKEKNKNNGPKKPAEEEKKPEEPLALPQPQKPLALPPGKESGDKKPEESKNDPQINKSTVIPEREKGFPGTFTPIPEREKGFPGTFTPIPEREKGFPGTFTPIPELEKPRGGCGGIPIPELNGPLITPLPNIDDLLGWKPGNKPLLLTLSSIKLF